MSVQRSAQYTLNPDSTGTHETAKGGHRSGNDDDDDNLFATVPDLMRPAGVQLPRNDSGTLSTQRFDNLKGRV